jgi:hypothetical protein
MNYNDFSTYFLLWYYKGGNIRGYKTLEANHDVLEEGEALYITKLCIFLAKCASWTISLPVLVNYLPSYTISVQPSLLSVQYIILYTRLIVLSTNLNKNWMGRYHLILLVFLCKSYKLIATKNIYPYNKNIWPINNKS